MNVTDYKYYARIRIHSNGYQSDEHRERFGLLYQDAWIYEITEDNKKFKLLRSGRRRKR